MGGIMKTLSKVLNETYDGQWDTFPSPTDTLEDYDNIIWLTDTPPTVENLKDLGVFPTIADRKAAYDAQAYARNREEEYPPWADQLDHIFHNGVASWKTNVVQPIKDKYPKG